MSQVFSMVPASSTALWVVAVILVPLMGLMGYIAYTSPHVRFDVSDTGLRIHGGFYGRKVPRGFLVCAGAKAVNLKADPSLTPLLPTSGIGLPGALVSTAKRRKGAGLSDGPIPRGLHPNPRRPCTPSRGCARSLPIDVPHRLTAFMPPSG